MNINSYIIFLTAYDKYALDAFQLNSVDYLLKPFIKKDISNSLKKLDRIIFNEHGIKPLIQNNEKAMVYRSRFLVKKGTKLITLQAKNIAFIFIDEVLFIVDNAGIKYLYDSTLDELEKELTPTLFFRVNRQFIVNYNSMVSLKPATSNRFKITLNPSPDSEVFVSQGKVALVKQWLGS